MSELSVKEKELLIANAELVIDTLQSLADNEIDSDYFEVTSENENGTEIDYSGAITAFTTQSAGTIKKLLSYAAEREEKISALKSRNRRLDGVITAAEKRIAELSKAASVNSKWKPEVCPITGREFFMWIEHPALGYVPTYGGPLDSYTIPTRDSDGEFSCERYDHDLGNWREGECVALYLIDEDEQCRVYELEQRIAELESRRLRVELPAEKFCPAEYAGSQLWNETEIWNNAIEECANRIERALSDAGIECEVV